MTNVNDANWLHAVASSHPDLSDNEKRRLALIEAELNSQPPGEGYDTYVVMDDGLSDDPPIAVRTVAEQAFDIARIYNLGAGGDRTASVYGYRCTGVGPGVNLEIPQ